MSKTAKVIQGDGSVTRLKVKKIAQLCEDGLGIWLEGVFEAGRPVFIFHEALERLRPRAKVAAPVAVSLNLPAVVPQSVICDSGQEGFLRYPQPTGVNSGPKWTALSRRGAGLAA